MISVISKLAKLDLPLPEIPAMVITMLGSIPPIHCLLNLAHLVFNDTIFRSLRPLI